ncbi:hypothetical protein CLOSCI_01446 [[Clostridium] scindens ATCC 35704]|nr:hypothetical protein CLOSCI_01446 [[Clostridium] scindens ATCC 35704]
MTEAGYAASSYYIKKKRNILYPQAFRLTALLRAVYNEGRCFRGIRIGKEKYMLGGRSGLWRKR